MKEEKILIIEDERSIAHVMLLALSEAGWSVGWASEGKGGLEAALSGDYALVLLDVMLPGKNGWDIVREVRKSGSSVPILMLSALDDTEDKVRGLRLGADGYLVKPIELAEMLAAVESLLRRDRLSRDLVTRVSDLELDRKTRAVTRRGHHISLSRREYDVLEALASHEGQPVDRDTLQRLVWTDDGAFDNTVDVFIRTLQQKVDAPFGQALIHAFGDGRYKLADCDRLELISHRS